MSQMKTYRPGSVKVTVATPPGGGWRKSLAGWKGMPTGSLVKSVATLGHSKLNAVWIVLASPPNEGNPTVALGGMTVRDFCPAVVFTHPSDVDWPEFTQVKKFPGVSPASNETVGAAAWCAPAMSHP